MAANGHHDATKSFDVLVIGAGISGINSAYRLATELPSASFAILEARNEIGGTWSLFKYPGVRSDSDLHTFGFAFNPWKKSNIIASGDSILEYMHETLDKFDLNKYFRFGQKLVGADWREADQQWRIEVDVTTQGRDTSKVVYWTRWLILGTGYYSYDKPMAAKIPGLENFKGRIVHPQFWPEDMEYKDKKIVIIGSGATAITLLPAMVENGAKMTTQLQRSPSYVLGVPQAKPEDAGWLRRTAPEWLIDRWLRFVNLSLPIVLYYFCRYFPTRATKFLRQQAQKSLPPGFPLDPGFKPSYKPWDQRLCISPNGDYFECFNSGRAKIVTDTIRSVKENGIDLDSGEYLEADTIVTATGLQIQFFGGVNPTIDGKPVDVSKEYLWRYTCISGLPNFGNIIGYWNHSWTLGSDISIHMYIRLIKPCNKPATPRFARS